MVMTGLVELFIIVNCCGRLGLFRGNTKIFSTLKLEERWGGFIEIIDNKLRFLRNPPLQNFCHRNGAGSEQYIFPRKHLNKPAPFFFI